MAGRRPRERYDDLIETRSREELEPAAFRETADSEPVSRGWVVLGVVFDGLDRVLMIEQPWADGWLFPGGVPEPDEDLDDAVRREVREETGVRVTPDRPHAVDELTCVHAETGATVGWTAVFYEATADTTAIDDDLGGADEDEEITDAGWFDSFPANVFNREFTERVYRRCLARREDRGPK